MKAGNTYKLASPFLALCALLLWTSKAQAQEFVPLTGTEYFYAAEATAYPTPVGTPNVLATSGDDTVFRETLPFSVSYFGTTYTEVQISINGVMGFEPDVGTTFSWSNSPVGSSGTPNTFIAPWWDDLFLRGGELRTWTQGTAPRRTFVVEWVNVNPLTSTTISYNFQVHLKEGSASEFEVYYGTLSGSGSASATVGFEGQTGTGARFPGLTCTNNCDLSVFSALSGLKVIVTNDSAPELSPFSFETPFLMSLDTTQRLELQVANDHRNLVGPYSIEIEADTDRDFSNPVLVGMSPPLTISPRSLERVLVPTRLPSSDFALGDQLFMRVTVDPANAIVEQDESNNVLASPRAVTVVEPQPELSVDAVTASTYNAEGGQQVAFTVTVSNEGGAPATTDVMVVISSNPFVSANDLALDTMTDLTLTPGETRELSMTVQLPTDLQSGSYTLGGVIDSTNQVTEFDKNNNAQEAFTPFVVSQAGLTMLTQRLPQPLLQEIYRATLQTSGASGEYIYALVTGTSFPDGISITENGVIFGRPSTVECANPEIQVTDAVDSSIQTTRTFEMCVIEQESPLTVVTRTLPVGTVNANYSYELSYAGDVPEGSMLVWAARDLPDGFSLSAEGLLSGTSGVEVDKSFDVTVTAGEASGTRTLQLVILSNDTLRVVPSVIPMATVGTTFSFQFQAQGAAAEVSWRPADTISQRTLREVGLDLEPSGLLIGAPNKIGDLSFEVEAFESGIGGASDRQSFTLRVDSDGALNFVNTQLPVGFVGISYDTFIAASGGVPEYEFKIIDGRLPDGINNLGAQNELHLAGAPTEDTETTLLLEVRDREGRTAQRAYTLRVLPAPVVVEESDDSGCTHSQTAGTPLAALLLFGLVGLIRRRSAREPLV